MKHAFLMFVLCSSALAQGRLFFTNRELYDQTGAYDAHVRFSDGTLVGPSISASLYLVRNNSESFIVSSPFRQTRRGEIVPLDLRIPGTVVGETATFRVKVWETAAGSYENAIHNGFCTGIFPTVSGNNEVSVILTGVDPITGNIARLNGLLPFSLPCIPEPGTSAILALGFTLLLLRRKR